MSAFGFPPPNDPGLQLPASVVFSRNVAGITALAVSAMGGAFIDTITGNVTYSAPTGLSANIDCNIDLKLVQDNAGNHTVTWFAGITWLSGSAPSIPTGAGTSLLVTLLSMDGGTTWFGSYGGSAAIEPWFFSTLQNSWVNSGAPNPLASYTRSTTGMVLIQGLVLRPGLAAGFTSSVIFTLRAGYRPATNLQRNVLVWDGSAFGQGQYLINSDGTVTWNWGGVAPTGNVSIDTSFRAEQ